MPIDKLGTIRREAETIIIPHIWNLPHDRRAAPKIIYHELIRRRPTAFDDTVVNKARSQRI
jgi:hypothetical protein